MPKQKKKFIPLPYKQLGKDISKYPFVEKEIYTFALQTTWKRYL